MARKKQKSARAGQKRARKSQRRAKSKGRLSTPLRSPEPLKPVSLERTLPAVYIGQHGALVQDPLRVLGLPPGTQDPRLIRDAWRERTVAAGLEQNPQRVAALRDARDRLIRPDRVLERELGVLHLPDVKAWGLTESVRAPATLDVRQRLLTEGLLYALLEDELAAS